MAQTQVAKLSEFHEEFARWTLENPEKSLRDASQRFGYSVSWLSIVRNSDAFKAHLATLSGAADAMVVADVPTRLRALADQSLALLGDHLGTVVMEGASAVAHREFVRDTAEMALKGLGYGRPTGPAPASDEKSPAVQVNVTVLESARERILNKGREVEVEHAALPAPSGSE